MSAIVYMYSITLTGWGLTKYKNGDECGFIRSKGSFTSHIDSENDARRHALRAIATANKFGRTPPTIHGVRVTC